MARPIRITAGSVTVDAELNDSHTATAIAARLPIEDLDRKRAAPEL